MSARVQVALFYFAQLYFTASSLWPPHPHAHFFPLHIPNWAASAPGPIVSLDNLYDNVIDAVPTVITFVVSPPVITIPPDSYIVVLCSLQRAFLWDAYDTLAWPAEQCYYCWSNAKRKEFLVKRPQLKPWLLSAKFNRQGLSTYLQKELCWVLGLAWSKKQFMSPKSP